MPSPIFTINGQPITGSVAVNPGDPVVCQLVDISGAAPVAWSVSGSDESITPGSYTFVQSGSIGQTYTGTALTPGTAGTIECTVAGGIDQTTQSPSSTMTARGKFFVPTRSGLEVLTLDEQQNDNRLSSVTHGCLRPINEAIRGSAPGLEDFEGNCNAGGNLALLDYALPTNGLAKLYCHVLARDTVSNDCAGYTTWGVWKSVAGVLSLIGSGYLINAENDATWSVTETIAASKARFLFTGDAANVVHVEARFELQQLLRW